MPRPACTHLALVALTIAFMSITMPAHAQWELDGAPISTAGSNQENVVAAADGEGGAVMAWLDARSGVAHVYAQRVNSFGVPVWTTDGVAVCTADPIGQFKVAVVSDGAGGAILAWDDYRSGPADIYAQRVDASGAPLWTPNGVLICGAADGQGEPQVTTDGASGAIITWTDNRLGNGGTGTYLFDIYARRVNASGTPLWTADGVAVCTATGDQIVSQICPDGSGGAWITWGDPRNGSHTDIFLRRVTAAGTAVAPVNGILMCGAASEQLAPLIVADGGGGAIVAWQDFRGGVAYDIYARRIISTGALQWTVDGVALCTAAGNQTAPQICTDDAGGAIVSWLDARNGATDIYARRVNTSGVAQWTADGVAMCTATGTQQDARITHDGVGGAIVSWEDARGPSGFDIYARRVNASGVPQWTADGVALSMGVSLQVDPVVVSDQAGGALVAWEDLRTGFIDVYAQRIERNGYWGYPAADIVAVNDVPGDQGGVVTVAWKASRLDPWPHELITEYTVWRGVEVEVAAMLTARGARVVRDGEDLMLTPQAPTLRVERTPTGEVFWEHVATVPAFHLQNYAKTVPTTYDSTSASSDAHHFQLIAHASAMYWISQSASGHSLDNLAPTPPLMLTAERVGNDVDLEWRMNGDADFDYYALYRATASGVQPIPIYFIDTSVDTVYTDVAPPGGTLYYIVTAYDEHENQSAPSNEASVTIPTDVGGDTPSLARLALRTNVPNPFTGSTKLQVGLPHASAATLEIFDVAGRRVLEQRLRLGAGWQSIDFDGRGGDGRPLPSGVYFYRIRTAGDSQSHKLVIQR